jgi:hypothetical protein
MTVKAWYLGRPNLIGELPWQAESHRRAAATTTSGKFEDEIVTVPTKVWDMKLCFPLLRTRSMLA